MMAVPYDTSSPCINYFDLFDRTGDSAFLKKALFFFLKSKFDIDGDINNITIVTENKIDDLLLKVLKGYSKLGNVSSVYSLNALHIDVAKSLLRERSSEFLDKFIFNYSLEHLSDSVIVKKKNKFLTKELDSFVNRYSYDINTALTSMAYGDIDLAYYIYCINNDDFINPWEYDGVLHDFKEIFVAFGTSDNFTRSICESIYNGYSDIMLFSEEEVRELLSSVYNKVMCNCDIESMKEF